MLTSPRTWWRHAAMGLLLSSGVAPALAQTPFVPYFGKNEVKYDTFRWTIYKTDLMKIFCPKMR